MITGTGHGNPELDHNPVNTTTELIPESRSRRLFLLRSLAALSTAGSFMRGVDIVAAASDPTSMRQRQGGSSTGKWLEIEHMGQDGLYGTARACAAMCGSYYTFNVRPNDRELRRLIPGEDLGDLRASFATLRFRDLLYGEDFYLDPRDMTDLIHDSVADNVPIIAEVPNSSDIGNRPARSQFVVITGHDEIWKPRDGKVFYNDPNPAPSGKGVYLNPSTFRQAWGRNGVIQGVKVHRI